jgi:hypothetical protein
MKKYMLIFTVIALIATSCNCEDNSKETKSTDTSVAVADEVTTIQMVDFDDKVGDYVGKTIRIKGTVDHICAHGGQKLFVVSEDSDARVKVTPDEEIAAFNAELEGDNIIIVGVVEEQKIDEAYLREWEEEIKAGNDMSDGKGEGIHLGGTVEKGGEDADIDEEMEKVTNLRNMIKESGTDHLSFYSILCTSFEVGDSKPTTDIIKTH